jgi:hypothetical protein
VAGTKQLTKDRTEIFVTGRFDNSSSFMEMRDRNLQNKTLDTIGRKLIASAMLRDGEIEEIAVKPDLFQNVRTQIRSNQNAAPEAWGFSSFLKYRLVFGSVFAAVFCLGIIGFYLEQRTADFVSYSIRVPEPKPDKARPEITPQVIVKGFTAGRADLISEESPTVQRTVYKQPEPYRPAVQRASMQQSLPDVEFYPVTYTGDAGETARGGRVIRVDVPRSTLFAMGVDVPLENESATLKADLLVGPDGITRAIRLVE